MTIKEEIKNKIRDISWESCTSGGEHYTGCEEELLEIDKMLDIIYNQAYQAGISHCAEAVRLEKIKIHISNSTYSPYHDGYNQACDDLAAKIAEIGGGK